MGNELKFDYYYGVEAEQFSFYRIPRLLIKDERFKELSSDAKLLYGLMLDRMALSIKNGWFDEENRAFIYYTLDNIMEDLGCGREKSVKVLAELDHKKGIGLIEKKRQGLGKPDIIYVKNFTSAQENEELNVPSEDIQFPEVRKPDFKESENPTSDGQVIEFPEVRKPDFKEFENPTSEGASIELPEVRKSDFREFENPTSEEAGTELPEVRKPDFKESENPTTEGGTIEFPEVRKSDFQKFENQTFGSSEIEFAEVREADAIYTEYSDTDMSHTDSINQSIYPRTRRWRG